MRRRLLAATATAALSLGLVACGDDSEGPVTEAPPSLGIGGSDGGGASDDGGEASDGGGSDDGGDATGSEGENSAAEEAGIPAPDPADYPGMDENTAEGAEQFTRYFIAVMTWGYQSGDPELFKVLFDPDCDICQQNADDIRARGESGHLWPNVQYEEVFMESVTGEEEYDARVACDVILEAHEEPDAETGEVVEVPSTRQEFTLGLKRQGDAWLVEELDLLGYEE